MNKNIQATTSLTITAKIDVAAFHIIFNLYIE